MTTQPPFRPRARGNPADHRRQSGPSEVDCFGGRRGERAAQRQARRQSWGCARVVGRRRRDAGATRRRAPDRAAEGGSRSVGEVRPSRWPPPQKTRLAYGFRGRAPPRARVVLTPRERAGAVLSLSSSAGGGRPPRPTRRAPASWCGRHRRGGAITEHDSGLCQRLHNRSRSTPLINTPRRPLATLVDAADSRASIRAPAPGGGGGTRALSPQHKPRALSLSFLDPHPSTRKLDDIQHHNKPSETRTHTDTHVGTPPSSSSREESLARARPTPLSFRHMAP
jgi:hypothetical protein